ncbi:MAG TPA: indole-3-glycerol phosphate synthase TrpC [Gemmatimonadaceae bacterium]|nr:indole-3-glycerol phosphate synthase TrpC [Gemmatimonadaceae bacterium]
MQASFAWTPPSGTLGRIVGEARTRARALESRAADLDRQAANVKGVPSFASALRDSAVAVIAEVKRRSPSKGWIQPGMDAADQACAYASAGARAISVLTEPEHFAGSTEDLVRARGAVTVPVLKKDFHVAPIQLVEAKALGASAALLIVRALGPAGLSELMSTARDLSLEVLIEIRDERELDLALESGASVVGINNRNLETLAIDASTSERLLSGIPAEVIAIGESGVVSRSDVERMARAGADAVLVGSSVSSAKDPAEAVRRLTGVPRTPRAL